MVRIIVKRWWILALAVAFTCCVASVSSRPASADVNSTIGSTDGGLGGDTGGTIGDPDVPTTPGKKAGSGALTLANRGSAVSTDVGSESAYRWLLVLRAAWLNLTMRWIGI
jgi:hypothetical protein